MPKASFLGGPKTFLVERLEPRYLLSGVIHVLQGLPDLQVQFADTLKLPADYLSGSGATLSVPLLIRNVDTAGVDQVALPTGKNATVTVRLLARPDGGNADGSDDIELTELTGVKVGNLAVGQTRKLNATVTLPSSITSGDYQLVAIVDGDSQVLELNEDLDADQPQANNVAVSAAFSVTQGLPDLVVQIIKNPIPDTVTSADGKTYTLGYRITNQGTLAVGDNVTTSLQVVQKTFDGADEFEHAAVTGIDISKLRPGASVNGSVTVFISNFVNDGENDVQQHFELTVDPDEAIDELNDDNNTAATADTLVSLGLPVLNVEVSNKAKVPGKPVISGDGTILSTQLRLTNVGNVAYDPLRAAGYHVQLFARPVDVDDDSADVELGEEAPLVLPTIAAGKSTLVTVSGQLPEGVDSGMYRLVATLRYTGLDEQDQIETFDASLDAFEVVRGYRNLVVEFAPGAKLPSAMLGGTGKSFKVPIVVRNTGNLALPQDATAKRQFLLQALDDMEPAEFHEGVTAAIDLDVAGLGPGQSKQFKTLLTIQPQVGAYEDHSGNAQIFVEVLPGEQWDTDDDDDNVSAGKGLVVTAGEMDLTVALAAKRSLPQQIVSGSGAIHRLPIAVSNLGNLAVVKDSPVSAEIYALPTGGGDAVLLDTIEGLDFAGLKPSTLRKLVLEFTTPASLQSGEYDLMVKIDSGNDLAELHEDNNESAINVDLGRITVTQGLPDLELDVLAGNLDGADLFSGDGLLRSLTVTVRNSGALATSSEQLVDFRIIAVNLDNMNESTVQTLSDVNVGSLRVDQARNLKLDFTLPQSIASGNYQLKVVADAGEELDELDELNNSALGPTLTITQGKPDLAVSFDDSLALPDEMIAGGGQSLAVPLRIANQGNIALRRDQRVTVTILAHNQADGDSDENNVQLLQVTGVSLGDLPTASQTLYRSIVQLPGSMTPGDYVLVAKVELENGVLDLDLTNNTAATA